MEQEEIKNIIIAAVVLSAAFAIFFEGGLGIFTLPPAQIAGTFVFALIIVFTAFVMHELGHRQVARRFGAYAEFRKWNLGLVLALLTSLAGFIFAAPGAVVIHPRADLWGRSSHLTRKKIGLISVTGPAINIAFALAFFVLHLAIPSLITIYGFDITIYGFAINSLLAFFNLLPIPPLDGSKVLLWDKRIWLGAIIISGVMVFIGM